MSMDNPLDIIQQMRERFAAAPHHGLCHHIIDGETCECYVGAVAEWADILEDAIARKYGSES
ncbi:hypothetical protein JTZ10_21510 [Gordonia rubripertincta]|uniref:Uncharacterized protein n=1 Tax=Gordonia rubripertincta TaxID=36822 RepID=A0AAW4GB48_GORRU|nr:hypothetical protein [Gordonia rubripertincta]MBM7280325.1 hypothetical protein [Gordonia rubripertincta]QMU19316.1 hypothetical protein H3V45_14565 [Gordonia rubripertincta]